MVKLLVVIEKGFDGFGDIGVVQSDGVRVVAQRSWRARDGVDEEAQRPKPSASISSPSDARRALVERPRLANPRVRWAGN